MFFRIGSMFSCLLFLATTPAFSQIIYEVVDLGDLGGSDSQAWSINNGREVTGLSVTNRGSIDAFLYRGADPLDLGTLGGIRAVGRGINNSGYVVGFSTVNINPDPPTHAFFSAPVTSLVDLGTLGGKNSFAFGINNNGQVVGMANTASGDTHAFVYNPWSGMVDLNVFLPTNVGYTLTSAGGTNDADQITGSADIRTPRVTKPFVYTPDKGVLIIDTPGLFATGTGINNYGEISGFEVSSSGEARAFLYSPESNLTLLGVLPGASESTARGLNNAGQVVGDSSGRAFLYTRSEGIIDLNTRIPNVAGWSLAVATAINDLGEVSGFGQHNGQEHAFLLRPQFW